MSNTATQDVLNFINSEAFDTAAEKAQEYSASSVGAEVLLIMKNKDVLHDFVKWAVHERIGICAQKQHTKPLPENVTPVLVEFLNHHNEVEYQCFDARKQERRQSRREKETKPTTAASSISSDIECNRRVFGGMLVGGLFGGLLTEPEDKPEEKAAKIAAGAAFGGGVTHLANKSVLQHQAEAVYADKYRDITTRRHMGRTFRAMPGRATQLDIDQVTVAACQVLQTLYDKHRGQDQRAH